MGGEEGIVEGGRGGRGVAWMVLVAASPSRGVLGREGRVNGSVLCRRARRAPPHPQQRRLSSKRASHAVMVLLIAPEATRPQNEEDHSQAPKTTQRCSSRGIPGLKAN